MQPKSFEMHKMGLQGARVQSAVPHLLHESLQQWGGFCAVAVALLNLLSGLLRLLKNNLGFWKVRCCSCLWNALHSQYTQRTAWTLK